MHPIEQLFASMPEIEPYPKGVVPVTARIPGTAFFPGGSGLWMLPDEPLPAMPHGGVMVLGHDFHSEKAFERSLSERAEVPLTPSAGYKLGPTWRNLLSLLKEVDISFERCFFTNAYMGLRQGSATIGRFPGSRDAAFVERCRRFFLKQISAQHPSVVLTLGTWVPAFVAPLSPELRSWQDVKSLADVDAAGPVVSDVTFKGAAPEVRPCSVVALTHPSLRGSNVRRRRYKSLEGKAAEVMMVRDALGA